MKNKRMKIARMECDMKQEDLAMAVGVTRQTIGLIEAGDYNPNSRTLEKL
ncbi:helix-turn-helix transcriptional regulator [Desulfosporosinus nitroreducens]|nr:helix-turn-helix domain-containing protein [Desulfosporosinus nitroreducens]